MSLCPAEMLPYGQFALRLKRKRMILKELEDYDWFPATLRRFQMEVIGHLVQILGVYRGVIPQMDDLVKKEALVAWVDLCSGSGVPAIYIQQRLSKMIPLLLTDKFPQTIQARQHLQYARESMDIFALTPEKDKIYTLFNALHHFTDEEKRKIFDQFKRNEATFLVVEILTPNLWSLIQVSLASTLVQICIAPFIKPFSAVRLLLTYILPVNILTVWVDGIISVFKSRTKMQYSRLFGALNDSTYVVETTSVFSFPTQLIVITAKPTHAAA